MMRNVICFIFGAILFLFSFTTGSDWVENPGMTKLSMIKHRDANEILGHEGHHESENAKLVKAKSSKKPRRIYKELTDQDIEEFFKLVKSEVKSSLRISKIVTDDEVDKLLEWLENDAKKVLRHRCTEETIAKQLIRNMNKTATC
ncbi:uncharacterized protein LOC112906447 [Agrilus planipennis]|uniref:Uncharacterized protein LOC112906447 n=1 Tax=Agrilus planipennis TaxID=224129 RepID=A0A7F5RK46_AGRPL|nr:uncharacterized protein LOC112906447 [Agrilus planipennis]